MRAQRKEHIKNNKEKSWGLFAKQQASLAAAQLHLFLGGSEGSRSLDLVPTSRNDCGLNHRFRTANAGTGHFPEVSFSQGCTVVRGFEAAPDREVDSVRGAVSFD